MYNILSDGIRKAAIHSSIGNFANLLGRIEMTNSQSVTKKETGVAHATAAAMITGGIIITGASLAFSHGDPNILLLTLPIFGIGGLMSRLPFLPSA